MPRTVEKRELFFTRLLVYARMVLAPGVGVGTLRIKRGLCLSVVISYPLNKFAYPRHTASLVSR
jgi:hypothetical protein